MTSFQLCTLPAQALDLYLADQPFSSTTTPDIENLTTLKKYHIKNIETAGTLQLSTCVFVRVQAISFGVYEPLPTNVTLSYSLVNPASTVLKSVTPTFSTSGAWHLYISDDAFDIYYQTVPTRALSLAGLQLPNQQYRIKGVIDPGGQVTETDETNNFKVSDDYFFYSVYSGALSYGPVSTQLTALTLGSILPCYSPTLSQVNVTAGNGRWTNAWGISNFALSTGCYVSSLNGADGYSYDLSATPAMAAASIGDITGTTPSQLTACLHNVTLSDTGAHFLAATVYLPSTVSVHQLRLPADPTQGVYPRGDSQIYFGVGGDFVDISSIAPLSVSASRAYHAYGLPFYVLTDTTQFDFNSNAGMTLLSTFPMYVHLPSYRKLNPNDPRSSGKTNNGFPSNDIYFIGYNNTPSTNATINSQGLSCDKFSFDKVISTLDQARTFFPQAMIHVKDGFDVKVANNHIEAMDLPIDQLYLEAGRKCPDGSCGELGIPMYYNVWTTGGKCRLSGDGSLGNQFDHLISDTQWGKFISHNGTFKRDDSDEPGAFYMPGFIMIGTSDPTHRTVCQDLLGTRLFDGADHTPNTLVPLKAAVGTPHADQGNGFFAGLTLGPEYLESFNEGAGKTLSKDLSIRFNGNSSYTDMGITQYTKYVMRRSGVTGVFNTDFSGVVNIYGYDLDFRRFAFRQVYNQLDSKTFLDGSLEIPYPCKITVSFLDLDLTCSGDLASGQVDSEAELDWKHPDGTDNDGDGLTDEGNGVLSYWRAPVAFTGLAFVATGNNTDTCANNEKKQLQLVTMMDFNGMDTELTMQAIYPVDGKITSQQLTGAAENVFDRPASGTNPGFSLLASKAYLDQHSSYSASHNGFLNLAGLTDVPLFNDIDINGQFQNPEPSGLALPDDSFTIFVAKNETASDTNQDGIPDAYGSNITTYRDKLADSEDASESGDPRPRAKYEWPSSGDLQLNFPLNYNRASGSKMPQFLGVKKTYSLISDSAPVITISSVPDYLNPKKTKFSFGASANVSGLLSFQVNLDDLGAIDDFLHNYLGVSSSFSLENLLDNFLNAENLLHEVTGGDLTDVLRPVVEAALDQPAVENVIEQFVDAAGTVNRIPQEISMRTAGVLEEFRGELTAKITGGVNPLGGASGQLEKLYGTMSAYLTAPRNVVDTYPGNPLTPAQIADIHAQLDTLKSALAEIESTLEDISSGMTAAKNGVNTLASDINSAVSLVNATLATLQGSILSSGGTLSAFTSGTTANPIIAKVDDVKDVVQDAVNNIKAVDIELIWNAFSTAASVMGVSLPSEIETQLSTLKSTLDEKILTPLEKIIQDANALLAGQYIAMPSVFDDANNLLTLVSTSLNTVQTQVNSIKGTLISYLDLVSPQVAAVKQTVESLRTTLDGTTITLDTGVYPAYNDLVTLGQNQLDLLASQLVESLLEQTTSIPSGALRSWLLAVKSEITSSGINHAYQAMFTLGVNSLVDLPLKEASDALTNELETVLAQTLSAIPAPTVEDIKNMIRNAVLNNDAVAALNSAFYDLMAPIKDVVDEAAAQLTDSLNKVIKDAIAAIAEGLNSAISSITSAIGGDDFGLTGASLDGYAIVNQEELEHLHIEANFTFSGDPDPTEYYAALDITSWNAENGKGACYDSATGNIDAVISTKDISADMLGCDIGIKDAALGFTLQSAVPVGIFGHVYTSGELNFEAVVIGDMGLEAGVGLYENYLGATASGRFEDFTLPKLAFYFGKCCDFSVLERLDPEVAGFIGNQVPLEGVYVRGSVEVPIYNVGCFFKVGVGADIGVWLLPPTYGGLVGGSAYGQLACLASIKGKVTCMGQKQGDEYQFSGSGWVGAGIGFCSPSDWNSISDVRDDDWCLTGDAQFGATYKNGWSIDGPSVNCCD